MNSNYLNMIKTTLTNMYTYLYDVTPIENKDKIIRFHDLPDPVLLFAIMKFQRETASLEIDKMIATYNIDSDKYKTKIIEYVNLLIDLSEEIKKTLQ